MPAREKVGNSKPGTVANRLLISTKKNSANRNGTNRMKSLLPMMSRPS